MKGLFGRRTMGKVHAMSRDGLREQQIAATQPYENVRQIIDAVMKGLDDTKAQIESSDEFRQAPERRTAQRVAPEETATFQVKIGPR